MANDIPGTSMKPWTLEPLHLGVSDVLAFSTVVSTESTLQTSFMDSKRSLFQTKQLRYPMSSCL